MGPPQERPDLHHAWFRLRLCQPYFQHRVARQLGCTVDYGETRVKAIGQGGPDILVVIYTCRGTAIRIFSARRANKKERAQWLSHA